MEIVYKPISNLTAYENNPRNNDKAVEKVAESIKQFGFKVPIVIDKNNVIVCGHTRVKAATKLGMESVPCIVADDLSEDQIKAFRLADNKVAEFADWDFSKLEEELAGIDMDMTDFGFEHIEEETPIEDEDEEVPEAPEEPISKTGDIWLLGKHRLMCGDSTSITDVEKLMDGAVADMVFTDPPYGMKKEADGVANDNLNYDDLLDFNRQWIPITFDFLKDMGAWYCWGIDEPLMDIYSGILKPMKKANKLVIRNYITWAKHSAIGISSSLMLSYPKETEKCWFVVKGQSWDNNNAEFFNTKFQSVLDYLRGEADAVGLTPKEVLRITGVGMYAHWFTKSQFTLIPEKHYLKLQSEFRSNFRKSHQELERMIGEDNNKNTKPFFDCTWFDRGDIGLTDVWRESVTSQSERELAGGHATPKPLALCERAIRSSSRDGEIVLDVFGGSGSTLIACEKTNRICYSMELEPKWVDVIIKRWEQITGEKAVLFNGND